ncbi:ATP-binding protein [Paenibacillus sp. JX-17]|uniref:ATP-binding protein n=1 Tax=Paenibacillus lacisoli TaxID=3064525 RepID=A0ABT9C8P8_9BACL|nr:ATP-binding protein [Paenibacillus sp. JX-17]MDO7905628.1 ATP-binding protein [Paenibacillus sp. JX-17]
MECVILIGIQASGKSTFYKERFFRTHMRINLDMLKTRHREQIYLEASLAARQPFVVDNTNPTVEERQKYIQKARAARFRVIGYYFEPDAEVSLERNNKRTGREKIPEIGIRSTLGKLTIPSYYEGFDELYIVTARDGEFEIKELLNQL